MTATKVRLLDAAESRFLVKGYAATTIDEICGDAGATKGAFFHHFQNKLDVALRAVDQHAERRFSAYMDGIGATASPRERVLAYVDGMTTVATSHVPAACLVTAMTVELANNEPKVRERCAQAFDRWTNDLVGLLAEARSETAPSPMALAHQVMSTYQGAMVVSQTTGRPEVLPQSMTGLRQYLETVL